VVRQRQGPSGTSLSQAIRCAHRKCRGVGALLCHT
jgi:hypothetical protein